MTPTGGNQRFFVLLIAICVFLFLFGLGSRALWDVDESKHSAAAKHVVESGDWVTPVYNGKAFFDKPMFFTWMVALSFSVLGFTEFAARLPAALLGLGGVLVTTGLARRMFGARAGFSSGLILASSLLFLVMARTIVHDSALAFFTTLALTLFYLAVVQPQRGAVLFLLFYFALSGAVLAKGPLGVVLPGLVIVPFLLLTRRWQLIREMRIGWGVVILLAVAGPWYLLMNLRNEGYLWYFLIEKNFGSFVSAESTHPAPFHFYIPILLGALLPWTAFLPAAIWRALRRIGGEKGETFLFLLLWMAGMFLFFSAATSKLASYLLPLMPAAAILIGALWEEVFAASGKKAIRTLVWSQLPLAALGVIGLVYGLINPPLELEVKYGISPAQLLTIGLLASIGPLVTLALLHRRRLAPAFGSVVVMVAAVLGVFATWVGPAMDDYRSTRELAIEIDPLFPPGEPMVFFWRVKESSLFYTDRDGRALPVEEVAQYLAQEDEVFFVADVRELHRLREHRENLGVVLRRGTKVVISNRPEAEQPNAVPDGFAR